MKKRVQFIIYSSSPKSGGGHYYSLLTLINSLSDKIEYNLLNVGLTYVEVLKNNKDIPSHYVYISKDKYFSGIKKIKKKVKSFNPDIIHAFDLNALRVARSLRIKVAPIIFSKCGGINGSKIIPFSDTYICFSQENVDHLNRYRKNSFPLYLIPNRAEKVITDKKRIDALKEAYNLEDKKVFLRISRFSKLHELSIHQAIDLFKVYFSKNIDSHLLLIGMEQEDSVLNEVKQKVKGFPISIITNSYFCNKASEIVDIADVVIATGRGVMEASSLGKLIFCPLKDSKYPVPFNEGNFDTLSKYNFSGRVVGLNTSEDEVIDVLEKKSLILSDFSSSKFKSHFDINTVRDKYLNIYHKTQKKSNSLRGIINYWIDMVLFFRPRF